MTENTPTPSTRCDWPECPGVAQERHEIESGPELHDLCKRVLAVTAERDAASKDAAEMARELSALTEIPEEDLLDVTTERDALRVERDALAARVAGWERDAQHPEFVPEEVTDAAFRSQESWWHPDRDSGVQTVVVPRMIEQVAEAAYRATLATIEAQR